MTEPHDRPGRPADDAAAARYDSGWHTLTRVNATERPRVVEQVAEVSPDLARWIVEFGYGDAYDEAALPAARRQLVTIGALTAMGGCEAQLAVHVGVALNVGVPPREIVAAVAHCVPFAGFPRAINAMLVVRDVFAKRGIAP